MSSRTHSRYEFWVHSANKPGSTQHAYSMSVWELVLEWGHLQMPPKLHAPIVLPCLADENMVLWCGWLADPFFTVCLLPAGPCQDSGHLGDMGGHPRRALFFYLNIFVSMLQTGLFETHHLLSYLGLVLRIQRACHRWLPVSNGTLIFLWRPARITICVCRGDSKALACFSLNVLNSCFSSGPLEGILKPRVRCKAARDGGLEVCKSLHLNLDFPGLGWYNRFLCLWACFLVACYLLSRAEGIPSR